MAAIDAIAASYLKYQYQMLWLAANSRNAEQLLSSRPLLLALICHKFPVDNNEKFGITQVIDYDDLCKEAKDQRHCVAIYHNRISAGHYAVYRMYEPERMTIGISINMKKAYPFDIEQIAGYKNALPSNETRQIIYDWFESSKVGKNLF